MNKDISWMKGSFGISSHYTQPLVEKRSNGQITYEEAIDKLDVETLADHLMKMGCTHYIFTLTHATQHLPFPCKALDKILKGRTCKRDFIGELIIALQTRGIRLIVYYNHACNGNDDVEWKNACGYAKGGKDSLDRFAENICNIIREISERYEEGISGWWFDSGYSLDPRGVHNTITTDMSDWSFPWEKLVAAAEAGNPNAAITINSGVGDHFRYYDKMDYWAGEMDKLDDTPVCESDDLQQTRWLPIESRYAWVLGDHCKEFLSSGYKEEDIRKYLEVQLTAGNMVTFNVLTDFDGTINPMIVEFFENMQR